MRRPRRSAIVVTFAFTAGFAVSAAQAEAGDTTAATLYVNNSTSTCTDSGLGTQATPFCTIQAAFTAVSAGQTVEIDGGNYTAGGTLTASGTASEPITVRFGAPDSTFGFTTSPQIDLPPGSTQSALTFSHANYVDIDYFDTQDDGDTASAVSVEDSSYLVFNRGFVDNDGDDFAVSGTSDALTVERMSLTSGHTAVAVGAGAVGTIVTTNSIQGDYTGATGVSVTGDSGSDIVGNDIYSGCVDGVSVSGGSTATTVENNIIAVLPGDQAYCLTSGSAAVGLDVTSDSAATTTEKYDTYDMAQGTAISWAGTTYTDASVFSSATGQGTHDITSAADGVTPAQYVDAADSSAPGELSTDFDGNPRVDDPQIPDTGTGTVAYYDRGAFEAQSPLSAQFETIGATGGRGVTADTYPLDDCGGWGATYTATLEWGDGQSVTETGKPCDGGTIATSHEYTAPGVYTVTLTVADGYSTASTSSRITTQGSDYTAYGPLRILDTRTGTGAPQAKVAKGSYVKVKIAGNGAIPADATAVALNLTVTDGTGNGWIAAEPDGAGTPTTSNLNYAAGQTLANAAIVQVPSDGYIDVYNGGAGPGSADLVADATGYFTPSAASGFAPLAPYRVLDTRDGTGAAAAKVAADSGLPVTIAGADQGAVPSTGVTAVALHVTVTDTTGAGWIAAEPDGAGTPTTSILNYGRGQTISNTVMVPVAADGRIELYNGGTSTPVDLVADVSGYYSAAAPNVYIPIVPTRIEDTRPNNGLKPGSTSNYFISPSGGLTAAEIVNLTVTEPTSNGFLTAYPAGESVPPTSNVNFGPGQTVADLAVLDPSTSGPVTDPSIDVHNTSTGTTQLVMDLFGEFVPQ